MAQLTHEQYEALERAIVDRRRIAVFRRGTEYIVVPRQLAQEEGRERIDAMHPTTGEDIALFIDEIDRVEVVR